MSGVAFRLRLSARPSTAHGHVTNGRSTRSPQSPARADRPPTTFAGRPARISRMDGCGSSHRRRTGSSPRTTRAGMHAPRAIARARERLENEPSTCSQRRSTSHSLASNPDLLRNRPFAFTESFPDGDVHPQRLGQRFVVSMSGPRLIALFRSSSTHWHTHLRSLLSIALPFRFRRTHAIDGPNAVP